MEDVGTVAVDLLARLASSGFTTTVVPTAGRDDSPFVVPDRAECLVKLRTTPDRSSADALAEVRSMLRPEWIAEAELVVHRDGWRLDAAGPAAGLARRLGHELGTGPTFDAPYWMEAPLWQRLCPTVVCGPSGGGLHAVDEWVDLRQVGAIATALVAVLQGWRPGAD